MRDDKRSAPYPFLRENAQAKVNSRFVDTATEANPVFDANDEWVYVYRTTGNPAQLGMTLIDQYNQVINVDEPFFVSGRQIFTVSSSDGFVTIAKAPRREMLSASQKASSGASNDPIQSILYAQAFTTPAIAVPATEWVYLDSNLQWQLGTRARCAGGFPFGTSSPIPATRRGRYYNVELSLQGAGGSQLIYYAPTTYDGAIVDKAAGHPISVAGAVSPDILLNLGDEPYARIETSVVSASTVIWFKSARAWTIAISCAVAGIQNGYMQITRRGF